MKVNKKEARWEQAASQASRAAAIRPETGRTEGPSHTVCCPAAHCLHPIFSAWPVTEGLFPCQKQTTQQQTTCHWLTSPSFSWSPSFYPCPYFFSVCVGSDFGPVYAMNTHRPDGSPQTALSPLKPTVFLRS